MKYYCAECGGSGICLHGRQKSHCKDCGGSQICQHRRQKGHCRECGRTALFVHGQQKSRCKECRKVPESVPHASANDSGDEVDSRINSRSAGAFMQQGSQRRSNPPRACAQNSAKPKPAIMDSEPEEQDSDVEPTSDKECHINEVAKRRDRPMADCRS